MFLYTINQVNHPMSTDGSPSGECASNGHRWYGNHTVDIPVEFDWAGYRFPTDLRCIFQLPVVFSDSSEDSDCNELSI